MRYTTAILSLAALTSAGRFEFRRQAAAGPVFAAKTFAELSISAGPAGNALANAQAKFAGLPADLATVDPADLQFLGDVNGLCNQAERGGFDASIEALATPGAEVLALDAGKSANKVLKLVATIMGLQIAQAQGSPDFDPVKLANESVKLMNNVQTDVLNGVNGVVGVSAVFNGTTADLAATENEKNKTSELAVENLAFQSRLLLGFADPPASKLARDNAAASVAAELAAAAANTTAGVKI